MILRLFGIQGIAGLVVALCLGLLLALQKGETRHWKKQSGQFEQLYRGEQAAFAGTVANYRAAAETARAAGRAAAERVAAEQRAVSERINDDYQNRLAAARAAADRLRVQSRPAADPGSGRSASVPGLSIAAGGSHQAAREDGFPAEDRLTATEQAIQLDELIKWVKAQARIEPDDAKE
jgi:hypothetical protein